MLSKIHSNEKEKNKEPELSIAETAPYKGKGRKLEFSKHETRSSSEESIKDTTKIYKDSSQSSDNNKKKKKYKPYEEIFGEFKKIKPPMFNREIKKGEEAKYCLSRMKKYFQIYNYYDELKPKMAIYNLTRK